MQHLRKTKQETNLRENTEKEQGITLIALVVTIVILLILAGITMQLVFSDNGILERAKDAKGIQRGAEEDDTTTLNSLARELNSIVTGTAIDPQEEYEYTGNTNASELIEGDHIRYYYKNNRGQVKSLECVVIWEYDQTGEKYSVSYEDENGLEATGSPGLHGPQIIPIEGIKIANDDAEVVKVTLGKDDPKIPNSAVGYDFAGDNYIENENQTLEEYINLQKAKWSYNNLIQTLNDYAEEYKGKMAIDARCVGSNPINKNQESDTNSDGFKNKDDNYTDDYNQLKDLRRYWVRLRLQDCLLYF